MDDTNGRLATPRILPLSVVGESERRACAVFALQGGETLALQATCVQGEASTVSAFSALCAAGAAGDGAADGPRWDAPVLLAIELPVPAALSLSVPPVLLRGGASDFAVAWAFEGAGYLLMTTRDASVVEGPHTGRITALCAKGDDLHAAMRPDGADEARIFVRPGSGEWRALAAAGVPCAANEAVTAIEVFEGHLYAAASNARTGFDLWRAPLNGTGAWEQVMTQGAWRYGCNPSVSAMAAIGDRLYVAADGADTSHVRIGDEHPEILSVGPDGRWQLFSGQARFSPEGLRLPATAGGPGAPGCSGLTIGSLQARGEDLLAWLKPRNGDSDLVSLNLWSAADATWSVVGTVPVPEVAVTSLALTADGTVLVAGGADLAALGAEAGPEAPARARRKPLLIASRSAARAPERPAA